MFDRFTERARRVMSLARQEAQRLNHDYIGTEHVLLGLVQEGTGVAAQVLVNLRADPRRIRAEVERLVRPGTNPVTMGQLPFTPLVKKTVESALAEAQRLGHSYIGTEHLLLGLLSATEGIAAKALLALGIRPEQVRDEVVELLGADPDAVREPMKAAPVRPRKPTATSDTIRALRAADAESARRRHGFIGTEHMLLGIVAGDDETARALHECGATVAAVQLAVDALRGTGDTESRSELAPFSVSALRALDRAWDEAVALGHTRVDSRHIALALLAVREGLAAQLLHRLVDAPDALAAKLRALHPPV